MQYLTRKRWQSSVDKWEEFIKDVKDKNTEIDFSSKYICSCGFCDTINIYRAFNDTVSLTCSACILNRIVDDTKYMGLPVCQSSSSLVHEAVRYADLDNWSKALKYGKEVLKTIKDCESEIDDDCKPIDMTMKIGKHTPEWSYYDLKFKHNGNSFKVFDTKKELMDYSKEFNMPVVNKTKTNKKKTKVKKVKCIVA